MLGASNYNHFKENKHTPHDDAYKTVAQIIEHVKGTASPDIEGIVETLNDKLVEANCNNFGECYVAYEEREDICNWFRATLKSQADQYEKEKGEVVKRITEHFDDFASAADTDTDYCRGVKFGLRLAIQYLNEKTDGVDLSGNTGMKIYADKTHITAPHFGVDLSE